MGCRFPQTAWPPNDQQKNRRLVFDYDRAAPGAPPMEVPCGKCIACRMRRRREWQVRMVHEGRIAGGGIMATYTYDADNLPADWSLEKRELQLLLKRTRNRFGAGLRFFGCGEYGESNKRPHYHVIYFGLHLPDRKRWRGAPGGRFNYRSASLEACWGKGNVEFCDFSAAAAAYVAGYVMKKVGGAVAEVRYLRRYTDPSTGEVREWTVKPEFALMSRRPGLGSAWFDRFRSDVFPSDFCVLDGKKVPVPGYYSRKLQGLDPEALAAIVEQREERALVHREEHPEEYTRERLVQLDEFDREMAKRSVRRLDGV